MTAPSYETRAAGGNEEGRCGKPDGQDPRTRHCIADATAPAKSCETSRTQNTSIPPTAEIEAERNGEENDSEGEGEGAGAQLVLDRGRLEASGGKEVAEADHEKSGDEEESANIPFGEENRQAVEMAVGSLLWVLVSEHTCLCADSLCVFERTELVCFCDRVSFFFATSFTFSAVSVCFPIVQQKHDYRRVLSKHVPTSADHPFTHEQQCRCFAGIDVHRDFSHLLPYLKPNITISFFCTVVRTF